VFVFHSGDNPLNKSSDVIDTKDLGERWNKSTRAVEAHRLRGLNHPPYFKIGKAVRYRLSDIEAFESANLIGRVA
jgi:hypothetical protein